MKVPDELEDNPLDFSKHHEKNISDPCQVVQVYLGMSSSSVPVDCMFSTTDLVSNGKRSSIGPEKRNSVLFIHDNFTVTFEAERQNVE